MAIVPTIACWKGAEAEAEGVGAALSKPGRTVIIYFCASVVGVGLLVICSGSAGGGDSWSSKSTSTPSFAFVRYRVRDVLALLLVNSENLEAPDGSLFNGWRGSAVWRWLPVTSEYNESRSMRRCWFPIRSCCLSGSEGTRLDLACVE